MRLYAASSASISALSGASAPHASASILWRSAAGALTTAWKTALRRCQCSADNGVAFDLRLQPGAGQSPVAFHRLGRDPEDIGGFFDRQAAEEAQFNDLRLPRVPVRELAQRAVDRDQLVGVAIVKRVRTQVDAFEAAFTLAAFRARAWSMRIRRMVVAATVKKWARFAS